MRILFVVPAYQVSRTIAEVVLSLDNLAAPLRAANHEPLGVLVIDDGSTDDTGLRAREAGAKVVRHPENLSKGAALRRGLRWAQEHQADAVVTVDGDGQHPASEALELALNEAPRHALVLGVRDMRSVGAPRANQTSNRIANVLLGFFARHRFTDSQCGLRRYPVRETLALGVRSGGYAFEAEVLLRARHAGWPLVEQPVHALYPPKAERVSHFHVVRDPWHIVRAVVRTMYELHVSGDTPHQR